MSQKSAKKLRLSQKKQDQSISQSQPQSSQNSDELINRCVRYFVLQLSNGVPIPRAKIVQQVFKEKPGRQYETIIQAAASQLENIYGLKLQTLKDSSVKKYVLTSTLKHSEFILKKEDDKFKNTIISLVLTHIFMNQGSCSEKSIWDFLAELSIKPENTIQGIGQVEQFVTKTLIKEQILNADQTRNDETSNKTLYYWGPVAEKSICKMDLLKFYSKMYDGISMTGFAQYKEAENQDDDEEIITV